MMTKTCRICGKQFETEEADAVCDACRTEQPVERKNEALKELFSDRLSRSDANIDSRLKADKPDEDFSGRPEEYWERMLRTLDIEYIQNTENGTFVPVFYSLPASPVTENADFKAALNAIPDAPTREAYRAEAEKLEQMRLSIKKAVAAGEEAAVFVCDRPLTGNGQEICDTLRREGIRVFRSADLAEGRQPGEYEDRVFAAMEQSDTMVLAVAEPADFYCWHVYSEWKRFLYRMRSDSGRAMVICSEDIAKEDIPEELKNIPVISVKKLNFKSRLLASLGKNERQNELLPENKGTPADPDESGRAFQNAFIRVEKVISDQDDYAFSKDPEDESAETNASGSDRKHRSTGKTVLAVAAAVVCVSAAMAAVYLMKPEDRYQQALKAEQNGNTEEAVRILNGIGTEDALDRINEIRLKQAEEANAAGDVAGALEMLDDIGSVTAQERAAAIRYTEGVRLYEAGDLAAAAEMFDRAGDYSDAAAKAAQCRLDMIYADASRLYEAGDYSGAAELFDRAGNGSDAAMRAAQCRAAQLFEEGRYEEAYAIYAGLDPAYADRAGWYREQYEEAALLLDRGEYEKAAEAFDRIAYYDNSAALASQARYLNAQALLDRGSMSEAAAAFAQLEDYTDSREKADLIARYMEAEGLQAAGDFAGAREAYAALNGAFDSVGKIEACYKAEFDAAAALMDAGDIAGACDALTGISEYGAAEELLSQISSSYAAAEEAMTAGDYDSAVNAYTSLCNFGDSQEKLTVALLGRARQRIEEERFEEAQQDLALLSEDQDVRELELELNTAMADRFFKEGDYAGALEHYLNLEQTETLMEREYTLANACIENGNKDIAVKAYESLNGYKDSAALLQETWYSMACDALEQEKLKEAESLFELLNGYKDSAEMVTECRYRAACALFDEQNYAEAEEAFAALNGYADSAEKVLDSRLETAKLKMNEGSYGEAEKILRDLNDHADSAELISECVYRQACGLMDQGDHQTAAGMFDSLGDYSNSAELKRECVYRQATELMNAGDNTAAAQLFAGLGDYCDSAAQVSECSYRDAIVCLESGETEKAEEIFLALNGYGDSALYIEKCRYQYALNEAEAGSYQTAANWLGQAASLPETAELLPVLAEKAENDGDLITALRFCLMGGADRNSERIAAIAEEMSSNGDHAGEAICCAALSDEAEWAERLTDIAADVSLDDLGDYLYDLGESGEAFASLDGRIAELHSESVFRKAGRLMAEGELEEAKTLYSEVEEEYPEASEKIIECDLQIARTYYNSGSYDEAYQIYIRYSGREDVDEILMNDENIAPIAIENQHNGKFRRAGNIVEFGSYDLNGNSGDALEPIEWIVAEVKDGKALLLSVNAIDSRKFNESAEQVTWEESSLRAWLNGEFVNTAFSSEETEALVTVENAGHSATLTGKAGNSTMDQVFILSAEEAGRLSETVSLAASASGKAEKDGAIVYDGHTWYWLRSAGNDNTRAATVSTNGYIDNGGTRVNKNGAVRPAVWVDIELVPNMD